MKAIRIHHYGSSDQIKVEEAPRPRLSAGQVLLRIRDAGVNPVDWKIREGIYQERMPRELPLTLGQDVAGEVVELGESVSAFHLGDPVFGFAAGAYAEFAAAEQGEIALKPRLTDYDAASALPTASLTAWQAVMDLARLSEGQLALIHGAAGGVGSFAVQLAVWRGARVVATASARDADYLRGLGVERVIDYKTERFERLIRGADAVIDLVGRETLERSYDVLKPGGVLVSTVGPTDDVRARAARIAAVTMAMRRDGAQLARIADLVDQKTLKPRLDQVLPLTDARIAQDLSQSGETHGKIVLHVA